MSLNDQNGKVIVVEGEHDRSRIHSIFPGAHVVITNGSEISKETLALLRTLNREKGLILFLDPDVPGERIRRVINEHVGETAHAFLPKKACISKNKKKVGIEHATTKDVKKALSKHKLSFGKSDVSIKLLLEWNLVGTDYAKKRREKLCDLLGIGLANGKTFVKKCHVFGIQSNQIKSYLEVIE
jgi:ribonuclease M5